MSLDFASLAQNSFGKLGTGDLAFQYNGSFKVVYEAGSSDLAPAYFITDAGNKRIQILDDKLNFISAFNSNGNSVLNSPNVIDANAQYISVSNANNAGDQIDFYNRRTNGFCFTMDFGQSFKQSMSFIDNKLFVLITHPTINIKVYKK